MRVLVLAVGTLIVTASAPWAAHAAGSSVVTTGTILIGAAGLGIGARISDVSHVDGIDLGFGERVFIDVGILRIAVPATHACGWDETRSCGTLAAAYYLDGPGPLSTAALWIVDSDGNIAHASPVGTEASVPATDMLPGDYAVVVAAHTGAMLRFVASATTA